MREHTSTSPCSRSTRLGLHARLLPGLQARNDQDMKVLVRIVGLPRFELGTSCPPDKRANQAAPQPVFLVSGEPIQRAPVSRRSIVRSEQPADHLDRAETEVDRD